MKSLFLALALGASALGLALPTSAHAQLLRTKHESTVATDAAAWVIADTTTGFILDSSNATKRLQIGSITKIATAMVVLDWAAGQNVDLGQLATVPETVTALSSPNSIGLQPKDQISLRDALYAALLQSDNMAAETLAVHVGRALHGKGTDAEVRDVFVAQMNALARKLDMKDTRFLNPHGLDDLESKLPYSTAGDVAKLTNYALTKSQFTFFTSQKERKISWQPTEAPPVAVIVPEETGGGLNQPGQLSPPGGLTPARGPAAPGAPLPPTAYLLRNTNELLGVSGVDGVKTGTTRKAGACVVLSAAQKPDSRKEGENYQITPRRLTIVVLASPKRFDTGKTLLAHGWALLDQWSAAGRPMKGWKAGTAAR